MLAVRFDCCDSSVVDWDSVENEEGGSAGIAHSERGDEL